MLVCKPYHARATWDASRYIHGVLRTVDESALVRGTTLHPRVHALAVRTPTLPPATHTNAYLVGHDACLLIEPATPYDDELARFVAWVRLHEGAGRRPVAIALTHHHADHVGGALALSRILSLPIWAHEETAARIKVPVDRHLQEGEVLALGTENPTMVEVLHTPGHAPGHLCFLEHESRLMVCGDMVAGVGSILVEPGDGDMVQYLSSLQRMGDLSPSGLLPAHGPPIADAKGKLEAYRAHRLMREAKVLRALDEADGWVPVEALLPVAYDDTPRPLWPLAARAAAAHLDKLVHDGKALRRDDLYRFVEGT